MNVVLKLSKLCNLRCVYCYEFDHLAEKARMPLAALERFFESLAQYLCSAEANCRVSFALHGGEPLLLPAAYLRELVALQQKSFGARGIPYENAAQTNLYRVPEAMPAMLEELKIRLGVSLDVFGGERVNGAGTDSNQRVKRNLQQLVSSGAAQRIGVGGISVLHAGNADRAADTFRFFAELGLDYRILPIFSVTQPPPRMQHLMLDPGQIVAALQAVLHAQLSWRGEPIRILPLADYFEAAVRYLSGNRANIYDPARSEWTLIVDTNGDIYNHSEAYDPESRMGNVFHQSVADIMQSPVRKRLLSLREVRAQVCEQCAFGQSCSRIPMIEALSSERDFDSQGGQRCSIAQPMIAHIASLIANSQHARAALDSRIRWSERAA